MGCIRGRRYADEMDVKIGFAENLRHGRHANGWYLCNKCGGYHIGIQKREEKCWATAKKIYPSRAAADAAVVQLQAKGREETKSYVCKYCKQYHLTSSTVST